MTERVRIFLDDAVNVIAGATSDEQWNVGPRFVRHALKRLPPAEDPLAALDQAREELADEGREYHAQYLNEIDKSRRLQNWINELIEDERTYDAMKAKQAFEMCMATSKRRKARVKELEAEILALRSQPAPEPPEQTMLYVGDHTRSVRCECGANVFSRLSANHYRCNGCQATYTGAPPCERCGGKGTVHRREREPGELQEYDPCPECRA